MNSLCLVLILFQLAFGLAQQTSSPQKPLTKSQVTELVAAGMDNERLVKVALERGIDFRLTGDYLAELRKKGALPVMIRALGSLDLKTQTDPLDKDLLLELVTAGADTLELAKAVLDRGIDFQPVLDYLKALEAAGAPQSLLRVLREAVPKPLRRDQLLGLLTGGVPKERVASLVALCGIDFKPTEEYLDSLRIAGADDALVDAVQRAKRPPEFVLVRTLEADKSLVRSLAFSPDGRHLASGGNHAIIKIWDVESGSEVRALTDHEFFVQSVTFDPSGRYLASGSSDNTIRLWEVNTGRAPRTLTGHTGDVNAVAFSPDGRFLASGSQDNTVGVWDVETGNLLHTMGVKESAAYCVAFSPDGHVVASGWSERIIKLWDVETGDLVRTLSGHTDDVTSLAFSPDGRLLASASGDKTAKLWQAATGSEQRTLTGHTSVVWAVAFSPDGRFLASGSGDYTVKIWEVETGLAIRSLTTEHGSTVSAVAFSPDGRYLASGDGGEIRLWRRED